MTEQPEIDRPLGQAFRANLYPCPLCEEPMVMVNGENTTPVTFWARGGVAYVTPHKTDCRLMGEMVPDGLDLIGLLHEKRMKEKK